MFPALLTDRLAARHAAACLSTNSVHMLEAILGSQQNGFCLGVILSSSELKLGLVAIFFSSSSPPPPFPFLFFFPSSQLSSIIVANLQDCSF